MSFYPIRLEQMASTNDYFDRICKKLKKYLDTCTGDTVSCEIDLTTSYRVLVSN